MRHVKKHNHTSEHVCQFTPSFALFSLGPLTDVFSTFIFTRSPDAFFRPRRIFSTYPLRSLHAFFRPFFSRTPRRIFSTFFFRVPAVVLTIDPPPPEPIRTHAQVSSFTPPTNVSHTLSFLPYPRPRTVPHRTPTTSIIYIKNDYLFFFRSTFHLSSTSYPPHISP